MFVVWAKLYSILTKGLGIEDCSHIFNDRFFSQGNRRTLQVGAYMYVKLDVTTGENHASQKRL